MRKLILAGWLCLSITALLLVSCKKEVTQGETEANVLYKEYIIKVNFWLNNLKADTTQGRDIKVKILQDNLDFAALRIEERKQGEKFLIIPIKKEFKTVNNSDKNPINNLLLILNDTGIRKGNIVQYMPLNSDINKAVSIGTFSKIFNGKELDCNGKFAFLSITDKFIYELNYKNGKLHSYSKLERGLPETVTTETQECLNMYLVTYYSNGSSDWQFLYAYCLGGGCEQTRSANNRMFQVDCGGGGGGGAGDPPVVNLLQDPCKNAALNAISSIGISNTISQFYNAVSSSSSPITIVFTESNNINGGGPAVTIPMGNNIYHTTLNNGSAYSPALMSQEAWGAILAHEILHVFILNGGLGDVDPGNYSHHTEIFTKMINTIRDLLHNAFGLDNAIATRLSLNGLADLWTFGNFDARCMSQYGYTLAQIEATFNQYSTGGLGTRCN